jgi:hypothetical protein
MLLARDQSQTLREYRLVITVIGIVVMTVELGLGTSISRPLFVPVLEYF